MNFEDIITIEVRNINWVTGASPLLQILRDPGTYHF